MTSPKRDTRNKGVTRDMVTIAAAQLLDEVGLERLSMRRVALHLGVSPMALYNHVRSKDDLLALLADHLRSQVRVDARLPPREQLVDLLIQLRDLGAQHPALLEPADDPVTSQHATELAVLQLRLLQELGLAPHQVRAAYQSLVLLVAGGSLVWRARAQRPDSAPRLKDLARATAGEQDRLLLDSLDALPAQSPQEAFLWSVQQVLSAAASLPPP